MAIGYTLYTVGKHESIVIYRMYICNSFPLESLSCLTVRGLGLGNGPRH